MAQPSSADHQRLDAAWAPIQLQADSHTGLDEQSIRTAAGAGIAGAGQPLPYLDTIQRAFGNHDISGVRAHFGARASEANAALGSHAYATGNDIAFATESPSLHLVAHEAAHVVQQRAGVHLSSAVGQAGDSYEQHADAVADRVVRGESAADLFAGPSHASVPRQIVQRETKPKVRSEHLTPTDAELPPMVLSEGWAPRSLPSFDADVKKLFVVDERGNTPLTPTSLKVSNFIAKCAPSSITSMPISVTCKL